MLKQKQIIAEDKEGLIVIAKPDYISKADNIMIDKENKDRAALNFLDKRK